MAIKKEYDEVEESMQYPSGDPEYPDVVKEEDEECMDETTEFPSGKGAFPDTYLKTKVRESKKSISMAEWFNIGEAKKKDKKKDKKLPKSKKKSKKINEAKYNTPEEFMDAYASGDMVKPEELSPLVLDFARSHNWDIGRMKNTLYKKLIKTKKPLGQLDRFDIGESLKK